MLPLVVVLGFAVLIVRALLRPAPTKWKRIKSYSRVRWLPDEISVPDDGEPPSPT
jgi:hypothetical protein